MCSTTLGCLPSIAVGDTRRNPLTGLCACLIARVAPGLRGAGMPIAVGFPSEVENTPGRWSKLSLLSAYDCDRRTLLLHFLVLWEPKGRLPRTKRLVFLRLACLGVKVAVADEVLVIK